MPLACWKDVSGELDGALERGLVFLGHFVDQACRTPTSQHTARPDHPSSIRRTDIKGLLRSQDASAENHFLRSSGQRRHRGWRTGQARLTLARELPIRRVSR